MLFELTSGCLAARYMKSMCLAAPKDVRRVLILLVGGERGHALRESRRIFRCRCAGRGYFSQGLAVPHSGTVLKFLSCGCVVVMGNDSLPAQVIDYKTFACRPATIAPYVWKYLWHFIHGDLLR